MAVKAALVPLTAAQADRVAILHAQGAAETDIAKSKVTSDLSTPPVMGAAASVLASATGTSGSAPGAGGLMGLVNSGSALYSALTNGVSNSIASAFD
mgnify:CR=1 FL=1